MDRARSIITTTKKPSRTLLTLPPNKTPTKNSNQNQNPHSPKHQCLLSLLHSCSSLPQLLQIHSKIQTLGLSQDPLLSSHLLKLSTLSPFADLSHARSLLAHSPAPSRPSLNDLIRAFSHSTTPREALVIFLQMRRLGITPNELTYPFVLKACAHLSGLQLGKQVHADCMKNGMNLIVYVQNTLMLLYGSCSKLDDVQRVFDEMSFRTVVSWNTILSTHVNNLLPEESVGSFIQMRSLGFEPDQTTFVVLLSVAAELGSLGFGKWIHTQIIKKGFIVNLQLGTAIINMYTKCGDLSFATHVFGRMPVKNVWTWSAMILGFAQHGSATEALNLFEQMKESSIEPNYVTFLGVLCACSHAGLVSKGHKFFHEMVYVHGIKPMMTHYSAMVDVIGRKGYLLEAYDFVRNMPIEPDAVVWRTLLSACQLHSSSDVMGIGEKVKKRLLDLEPSRSGNFVMVANMYSEIGSWDKAAKVRRLMKEEGLKKIAAESCVEVGGVIHRFLSGDDTCKDYNSIYHLLGGLKLNMKMLDFMDVISLED